MATPAALSSVLSTSTPPAIHGPYEDLGIEMLKTIQVLLQSQPPEVQKQLWGDYVKLLSDLQTFAAKIDVFHLFTGKT